MITKNPMTALERRSVTSLALLYSFRMLGLFMVLPLLALYAADLPDATPLLIGLALGVYGLTQAILQIPFGWLSDRIGRKPVIVSGLVLFALGSVVAGMADTAGGIIVGRALQGAGAIAGTVMALAADLTRDEQRTKAMALIGVSIGLSFAVAFVLGPLVAGRWGLSAVFFLTAVLAVVGIAIVLLRVPTPIASASGQSDTASGMSSLISSFLDPSLARLNFGVFVLHLVLMSCFLIVPQLLEDVAEVPRELHWQIYLPALVLSVVGMLPLLRIAERGGRPHRMFVLGITIVMVAILVLGFGSSAISLYIGLWGFFVGFNYLEATLPSLVSKTVAAGDKGAALGMYSTCQFFGAFCGGAGGGWLVQYTSAATTFLVSASLIAIWLLVASRMTDSDMRAGVVSPQT
ncbi:MAG: MFS family permease [Halioglobus sp.]